MATQSLNLPGPSSSSGAGEDPLRSFLYNLYREGKITTNVFQKGAQAALSLGDGSSKTLLSQFANLGGCGTSPQHMLRDFERKLGRWTNMPDLYKAFVPMWDPKTNRATTGPLHFLLPHELLPMLVGMT